MMGNSYLSKKSVQNGEIDFDQADRLSHDFNLSISSVEEIKRKYLMYRGKKTGINIHNYVILFREYVNQNANEIEIYKSFNAFDSERKSFLNFVQLLTAISCLLILYFLKKLIFVNFLNCRAADK
jgi:hypothetical protein